MTVFKYTDMYFFCFRFDHSSIIKAVEYYENDKYFSMVMPTHGDICIDLFEFIDRDPALDEALASYIFRQVQTYKPTYQKSKSE